MLPLLRIENLKLHYCTARHERLHIINGVSLEISRGEILGIAGEPGSGKTALAQGMTALFYPPLHYTSGDIRLEGQSLIAMDIREKQQTIPEKKIALIPQNADQALPPHRTTRDFALEVLRVHMPKLPEREALERVSERLEYLGLSHSLHSRYPDALDPFERRRSAIAIATLMNPQILITDDPFQGLDFNAQKQLTSLLMDLVHREIAGSLIVLSSDLPVLRHIASFLAILYAGEFVEYGPTNAVIENPGHPYSRDLIAASIPPEMLDNRPAHLLEGSPPDMRFPPQGCRYAIRCPQARSDCSTIRQIMRTVRGRDVRCMYAR